MNNLREMIESMILTDDDYEEQMAARVVPLLNGCRTELWLSREDNPQQKLYCCRYACPCGGEGAKGAVVISHGYTENAEKYREVIYYFLKMGYHVYIFDHCGHGRSYRLTEELYLVHVDRYGRYADDLLRIAHQARSDYGDLPLYLFGHSMGGGIGAAAAAMEPDLFRRVILSSPMVQPDTRPLPWRLAGSLAGAACLLGKSARHLPGGHPFDDSETFEESSAMSRARFDYQQQLRRSEPLFQNTYGTYGWTRSAAKLHRYLMRTAWKKICVPLLLFQAEDDHVVSGKAQYTFIRKLDHRHAAPTWLIKVPGCKHEIYNATPDILVKYWTKIFRFLS